MRSQPSGVSGFLDQTANPLYEDGDVGIINPAAMPKGAWFTAHVLGRKIAARVTGTRPWKISIADLQGRVIAVRNDVRAGSSCVVAERLAPGVYCAQFTYDKIMTWRKTITVQ
jgi:hypothetical protein